MKSASVRIPNELLEGVQKPCVSIYMPTNRRHPENIQDALRFKNLVITARDKGWESAGKRPMTPLLDQMTPMMEDHDFWMHGLDGLAVFAAPGLFRVIRLQEPVPELVVVTDRFYIKPLLRIFQAVDRYHVLALSRTGIRLFEGNRYLFDEIMPSAEVPRTMIDALGHEITPPHQTMSSYNVHGGDGAMSHGHSSRTDEEELDNERYFRAVDRAVTECHSMPSGLPLVLAALPEHQSLFRSVSHNPYLLDEGVIADPRMMQAEDLRGLAWNVLEPLWEEKIGAAVAQYEEYRSKRLGDDDPVSIARAAIEGRVSIMLLDSDIRYPGVLDCETGDIVKGATNGSPDRDVLDDLALMVMNNGGEVMVLPSERMPTMTGVAAIFRY